MSPRKLAAAGVAGVAVIAGGGWAAYAAAADDSPNYRVATVTAADVEQTLSLSGTLERTSSADLAFTASGTISKLSVSLGSTVKKGQVIARLDTTDLQAAVTKAEASVASAKAQLASDKEAQADYEEAEDDAEAAAAKAKKAAKAAAKKAKAQAAAAAAAAQQAATELAAQ
ncbi:MAG: biotin/lipoyl-binding protein, partial [Nocardioides sp.]|uniref:biotin/lipoyl-binding protein n=1 Tax=Nocardioides sp. TaxID=35761 RepID=UPI0039E5F130